MLEPSRFNRRRFLQRAGLIGASALLLGAADAAVVEPHWLRIRRVRLSPGAPVCRFAFFTDMHYKGDRAFGESVVGTINAESPDFVCFGGDLIEQTRHLPEALAVLSGIKAPLYGVPGNHDYYSRAPFAAYRECFAATGGGWLVDENRELAGGRVNLIGLGCNQHHQNPLPLKSTAKNIVLMHYPAWIKKFPGQQCDLMLAGHAHGGQVRLPFIGSLVVPFNVDKYDMGLFQTVSGPLYVNPGIGWFYLNVRLNCRPEVTIFEI